MISSTEELISLRDNKKYTILYSRSQFREFKNFSSARIEKIDAPDTSDFSLVMAKNHNKEIGFDQCEESLNFTRSLISNCFYLNLQNEICPPQQAKLGYMPHFLFRGKDGEFEKIRNSHVEYKKT